MGLRSKRSLEKGISIIHEAATYHDTATVRASFCTRRRGCHVLRERGEKTVGAVDAWGPAGQIYEACTQRVRASEYRTGVR